MNPRPIPVITGHEHDEKAIPRVPTNTPEDSTRLQDDNLETGWFSHDSYADNTDVVLEMFSHLEVCDTPVSEEEGGYCWEIEVDADQEVIEKGQNVIDENAVHDILLQIRASEGELTLDDLLSYRVIPISQATRQEIERQLAQNAPADGENNDDNQDEAVAVGPVATLPSPNLARAIGTLFSGAELNAPNELESGVTADQVRNGQSSFTYNSGMI